MIKTLSRCFLMLLCLTYWQVEASTLVEETKKNYEETLESDKKPLLEFEAMYVRELRGLLEKVQASGNLKAAITVKEEIEEFRLFGERDFSAVPELAKLRRIYEINLAPKASEVAESQEGTQREFAAKFDALKVHFTKNGNLDLAIEAENEAAKLRKELKPRLTGEAARKSTDFEEPDVLWRLKSTRDFTPIRDCIAKKVDDVWELSGLPGKEKQNDFSFIASNENFSVPFRISSRVATDSFEVRYYLNKNPLVVLMHVNSPDALMIHDPLTKNRQVFQGKGTITPNEFHEVQIDVRERSIQVFVNGELRAERLGDYANLRTDVSIGQACGSTVTVERHEVHSLK